MEKIKMPIMKSQGVDNMPRFGPNLNVGEGIQMPFPAEMTDGMNRNQDIRIKPDGSLPMNMEQMSPEQRAMGFEPPKLSNNPFPMERMNSIGIPDAPIQFSNSMIDQLLSDNEVPEKIKNEHWYIFHKDNTLTFLDTERKNSKLLNFDILKIDMLNSMPYYDYTFEKEKEFGILRNVYETKLDRAMGFTGGNIKNERVMLNSQFSENRQISELGNNGGVKEGFFKRLLGRR